MSGLSPVCAKCKLEMECVRNDVAVWHPWEPANLFSGEIDFVVVGDRYKCPKCGASIITGFGEMLTAVHNDQESLRCLRDVMEEKVKIMRRESL